MYARHTWKWYLVVDDNGNVLEAFNSEDGATLWAEKWGGTVIPVKEAKIRYE